MNTRALATAAIAATASLSLAMGPATASTDTTTTTESFGSSGGLASRGDHAPSRLPELPSIQQQRTAGADASEDLLTRYYVRGYQTLNDTYSTILGDVDVTVDPNAYCYILSNMNLNGIDRDEPALTYAGAYDPKNPLESGGPDVPALYGAATYRFGPHYFFSAGADEECFTDDDDLSGFDETLSNAVRIRYASKAVVQYTKSGSRKKVHVLARRFDKSDRFVGLYSVKLQYRTAGSKTWRTKKTIKLDKSGRADYYFSTSRKYYYRVAVSLTDNVQSSYSSPKYM